MKKSKQKRLQGIAGSRFTMHTPNGVSWLYAAGVPVCRAPLPFVLRQDFLTMLREDSRRMSSAHLASWAERW